MVPMPANAKPKTADEGPRSGVRRDPMNVSLDVTVPPSMVAQVASIADAVERISAVFASPNLGNEIHDHVRRELEGSCERLWRIVGAIESGEL